MKYIFSTADTRRYRFPTHINDLVMDRSEATSSEVFVVVLAPGEAPPPHQHDDTEQIFYVLSGQGRLEIGPQPEIYPVNPGDVIRIPPETQHSIQCTGAGPLTYLAIDCFPAGRPQAEPTWDAHVKTICRQQGWAYEQVIEQPS
jgi:quercetin dioxygenase-like cupin family protein